MKTILPKLFSLVLSAFKKPTLATAKNDLDNRPDSFVRDGKNTFSKVLPFTQLHVIFGFIQEYALSAQAILQPTQKRLFKGSFLAFFMFLLGSVSYAQVYKEDFGSNSTVSLPYTYGTNATGSATKNTNFTNPVWTQSLASANFAGSAGGCMSGTSSGSTNSVSCTFTVASGFKLTPSSIVYNYRISGTGPTALNISISGTGGSTSVAAITTNRSGSFIGATTSNFASTTQNITGTVTLTFAFSGGSSGGTMRLDDITLNGAVAATTPIITGTATTAAFNTTYGTASSAQSFSVSGSALTANLVANAPTGFQVSSDGTNYGTTATFTQTSGSASGTLRIRLAANAAVGAYNSKVITLTSTGATTVNITTPASGNAMSAKALTIIGITGVSRLYDATAIATFTGGSYSGLVNGETFSLAGTPAANFANKLVGTNKPITISGYTAPSANYTLTAQPTGVSANITAADLTIEDAAVTAKTYDGSTAATITGTLTGVIGSDNVAFNSGSSFFANSGPGTGIAVTAQCTLIGTDAVNYSLTQPTGLTGDINAVLNPTISLSPASAGSFTTVYGTASTAQVFTVTGSVLTNDVTATAQSGFEVSLDGTAYGSSVTYTQSGGSAGGSLYIRLTSSATAATYNSASAVTLTSSDATDFVLSTPAAGNIVNAKTLTITGLSGISKLYDGNSSAEFTGTPAYSGLENGETFPVSGTGTATFASKTAGTAKTVTISGYAAPSSNYTLTEPTVSADITAVELTVSGAAVTTKTYNGNTNAVITGATLVSVVSGDIVTVSGGGSFASANVGTVIEVTSALLLGGIDAVNYTLAQPSLTGDIIKASQTITGLPSTSAKSNTDNPYALTAVASSGLPVSYTSSNEAVATISGSTVTIVGIAGTATITASQAGDSNYNAAANVTQVVTVTAGPSTLAAGDLALLAVNASTTDTFSFVLLKGINTNTVINFTDNGFTGTNTTGRTGEGFLTYTSPTALPFGTVLTWTSGQTNSGWAASTTNFSFNASGDQLFVFQGDTANWGTQSGIILLFGLNYGVALNATSAAANTIQPGTTILPVTAFLNLPASPNVYYSGTGSTATAVDLCGTAPVILANAVTAAKWFGSGSANTFPTYTVTSSCSRIVVTGTATAFTTTYGTASAARNFSVSGTGLTANLVATAPTGFEVSADGITYNSTAAFVQTSGTASGTLRVRLAATASVTGLYNSKNIVLSSTGATSATIVTTASGNIVTAKALAISGINGVSKVYDGTASASVTGTAEYSGLVNGETFGVAGTPSYNFANKNVEPAKPILVTGFTAPSTNYTVSQPSVTADITAKDLTVTTITADNKVYDGTVNATLSATLEGVVSPDNVTLNAIGEFENNFQTISFGTPANIVNLSFSLNGSDANNYNLVQPVVNGLTADISPKELTISNATASDKVYDGTTTAVVSGTLEGVVSGDVVTLISSGAFATADIGANITVTPTWNIDGDTFNYTLTVPTVSLTANITSPGAPTITSVTTASATYGDLTTLYAVTTNVPVDSYNATGLPTGLTINTATGEITGSPTAAGVFTITLSATNNGGTGFAILTYTINTINLTISGALANNKQYDGTTNAVISGTLTGPISGDAVSFDGAGTFDTASVGANIFVTPGIALTGAKASNYTLTQPSGLVADITVKSLTVTASVNDKVYAGTTNTSAAVIITNVDGIVGSDAVTVNASGTFDTGVAGNGKNVAVNYALSGADASNYSVATPVILTGTITKKPLTYTATAENKVFDGNTNATVTASNTNGIISPDAVTITGTGTFASSAVGNGIIVSNVTMVLGGAQAANYSITQPGDLTANITSGPTVLTAGDIAVVGYNTSGSPDNIAILVLKDLSAGTQFFVNDNELATAASTSFTDLGEAEASFTVKSGQTIPAGTVIVLPWGAAAVSTTTYDWSSTSGAGLGNNNEEIYIYTASSITATAPTAFIYFAKIGSSPSAIPSSLETSTTGSGTAAITPNGAALRYSTTGTIFSFCKRILLNEIGKTTTNWNTTGASALVSTDWTFTVLPTCPSPTIAATGTVSALTAVYGSTSSNGTLNVSGSFLTNNIVVTAPAGFEVSLNATSGFAAFVTLTQASGTVASTPVYVRLLATNLVGTYSGDISCGTTGGTTVNVTIPSSMVTPKPLTITGIFINNKVENLGDFTATVSGTPVLNGVLSIDNANVTVDSSAATAVFTQDNAGTSIPVNVSGYALLGSAAANYSLTQPTGLTADITTVASPAITSTLAFSSVYGTAIASPYQITATSNPSFPVTAYNATNLPAGLTFDNGTQTIIGTPTTAGIYNVTISATNAGGTTNAILIYTITRKEITVTATAVNKVYNANDTAAITVNSILGVVGSEDVTVTGGGLFDTKNVGTAKTVTANLVLGGAKAANYSLTQPTGLSADVTPFALTLTGVSAQNKVFDGNNTAAIGATLVGIFSGDTVQFNGTGTFASAAVGTGIAVTSTATLTGTDAGNYSFVQPIGLTANITDSVLYANAFTGASACPTNGNIPVMAVNATGAPVTRALVTCMSTGNVFNSTTLNTTATVNAASYIEFSATAGTGYQLNVRSLSFLRQASNSAPNQLEIRYSTDGFATSTTMAGTPVSPTAGTILTWDFPDFNSAVAGTVTFRLYPYGTQRADGAGASAASGTFRVDDVTIFGSVITPTAAALSLVGENTICNGTSSSIKVDVTGGASPYTVVYQNQATAENFTVANYVSGTAIPVTPSTTGTNSYSLVSVTDVNGLTSVVSGTANITVNTCSTESVLNLKVFIQGYYNGSGMVAARFDNLTASGEAAGNATDVDEVSVELHDATASSVVAYTITGIVQTDGTLSVTFPSAAAGNSYYIVLKHRSSLQLWSANPVVISEATDYDFSTGLDKAYTDGSFEPMATLAPGVYGMYSGDLNQDDFIDPADFPSFELDQDNSAINGLYLLSGDMNGDTFVDPADYPVYDGNAYLGLFAQYPLQ